MRALTSRPDVSYKVTVLRERWSCECPFYAEAKQSCVHILSVRFREGFKNRPSGCAADEPGVRAVPLGGRDSIGKAPEQEWGRRSISL